MSVLRWILGFLLVLAALVVASLTAEPDSWRGAVTWAKQWRRTVANEKATCPVLVGEAESVNLFGDGPRGVYDKAATLAHSIGTADRQALRAMLDEVDGRKFSTEEAMAVVAQVPPQALLELQRAARTPGTVFAAERLGARADDLPLLDLIVLCDALLVTARYCDDDERSMTAWLDALAVGWDLAGLEHAVGEMVGLLVVERTLQVADEAWLRRFSRGDLRVIARALAKVDAATPETADLRTLAADMLLLVDETENLQPIDIGMRSVYQSWRNLFSLEDAAIERIGRAAEQIDAFHRETPTDEPWSQREARLQALVDADQLANSDLASGYLGHVMSSERNRRTNLAHLRLRRMAIAHLVAEELILKDPLGDGVMSAASGDGAVEPGSSDPAVRLVGAVVFSSADSAVSFVVADRPVPADGGR